MLGGYTISRDQRSGMWYAHHKKYPNIPIAGSFSEKKSEAMEYAKMYNGLPNKVEQSEQQKKERFEKEMGLS